MARTGIGDSVEGLHAVAAALRAGRVLRLTVEEGRAENPDVAALTEDAVRLGIPTAVVDDVRPLAGTTAPQGVVAECRPLQIHTLEELVAEASPASMVMIDHVEDPHNLGAIARSAVAAGIPRVVVAGRRAAPLGPAAFKAAAGAFETCSVAVVSSVADAVRTLGKLGVWTVGLDASGDRSLFGLDLLGEPVALVVGGETGLHRLVRDRVDVIASIPMMGPVESLNASVAAGIACFELMRVRMVSDPG